MKCNCIKEDVCKFRREIINSLDKIMYVHFGGMNPAWNDFEEFIKKHCRYRKEDNE